MVMNENYNLKMEKIIENIKKHDKTPTILLHSCCAPCSSAVIERLSEYFDITIYYYNPNIEPLDEYLKRKEEQKKFLKKIKSKNKLNFLDCDYDNLKFKKIASGLENIKEGGTRCFLCYNLRLESTALKAKEQNYDYFGTTLSVSPYKNAKKLNEIGLLLQDKYKINFLIADFKKKDGYKRSIALSNKYNLYRQDYCGCIYSQVVR